MDSIMRDNVVELHKGPRISVLPVLEADFDAYLDRGLDLIAPAVERQAHNVSMKDIAQDIITGGSMMWVVHIGDTLVAAMTTCVVQHPRRKNLKIEFLGGSRMNEWIDDGIATLAKIAKDAGLDALEADGRKGFEKISKGVNFTPIYTHYEMELI
jgi:hypothetical protein